MAPGAEPEVHLIWDSLRAETLRFIIKDLGLPAISRRGDMIARLKEIETTGSLDELPGSDSEEEIEGAVVARGRKAPAAAKRAPSKKPPSSKKRVVSEGSARARKGATKKAESKVEDGKAADEDDEASDASEEPQGTRRVPALRKNPASESSD